MAPQPDVGEGGGGAEEGGNMRSTPDRGQTQPNQNQIRTKPNRTKTKKNKSKIKGGRGRRKDGGGSLTYHKGRDEHVDREISLGLVDVAVAVALPVRHVVGGNASTGGGGGFDRALGGAGGWRGAGGHGGWLSHLSTFQGSKGRVQY